MGIFTADKTKLEQYPDMIAKQETEVFQAQEWVRISTEYLADLKADIEVEIANDATLKNDQQRKAKRAQLSGNHDYVNSEIVLQQNKEALIKAQIELDRLKNAFSVEKLLKREQIARLESVA